MPCLKKNFVVAVTYDEVHLADAEWEMSKFVRWCWWCYSSCQQWWQQDPATPQWCCVMQTPAWTSRKIYDNSLLFTLVVTWGHTLDYWGTAQNSCHGNAGCL